MDDLILQHPDSFIPGRLIKADEVKPNFTQLISAVNFLLSSSEAQLTANSQYLGQFSSANIVASAPVPVADANGLFFAFDFSTTLADTALLRFNLNDTGFKNIVDADGQQLRGFQIKQGAMLAVIRVGDVWKCLNPLPPNDQNYSLPTPTVPSGSRYILRMDGRLEVAASSGGGTIFLHDALREIDIRKAQTLYGVDTGGGAVARASYHLFAVATSDHAHTGYILSRNPLRTTFSLRPAPGQDFVTFDKVRRLPLSLILWDGDLDGEDEGGAKLPYLHMEKWSLHEAYVRYAHACGGLSIAALPDRVPEYETPSQGLTRDTRGVYKRAGVRAKSSFSLSFFIPDTVSQMECEIIGTTNTFTYYTPYESSTSTGFQVPALNSVNMSHPLKALLTANKGMIIEQSGGEWNVQIKGYYVNL
jgi:hypothetical protein